MSTDVLWFSDLGLADLPQVGGKNASLGELIGNLARSGMRVPDGFATSADAYRRFLGESGLAETINAELDGLDTNDVQELSRVGSRIRSAVVEQPDLDQEIRAAHEHLAGAAGDQASFAVRSSATAEDLPNASFVGQQETFLNIRGVEAVLTAIREVFAHLYDDRAFAHRVHHRFAHGEVALPAGVQRTVRSDLGAAGVMLTLDTESDFDQVVLVTSAYGLGEGVVQGAVTPVPTLRAPAPPGLEERRDPTLVSTSARLVYVVDEIQHALDEGPPPGGRGHAEHQGVRVPGKGTFGGPTPAPGLAAAPSSSVTPTTRRHDSTEGVHAMSMLEEIDQHVTHDQQVQADTGGPVLINIHHVETEEAEGLTDTSGGIIRQSRSRPRFISAQFHHATAGSGTCLNHPFRRGVAHYRAARPDLTFRGKLASYLDGSVATPHLLAKVAIPNVCVT